MAAWVQTNCLFCDAKKITLHGHVRTCEGLPDYITLNRFPSMKEQVSRALAEHVGMMTFGPSGKCYECPFCKVVKKDKGKNEVRKHIKCCFVANKIYGFKNMLLKVNGVERLALAMEIMESNQSEVNYKINSLKREWKIRDFNDPGFFWMHETNPIPPPPDGFGPPDITPHHDSPNFDKHDTSNGYVPDTKKRAHPSNGHVPVTKKRASSSILSPQDVYQILIDNGIKVIPRSVFLLFLDCLENLQTPGNRMDTTSDGDAPQDVVTPVPLDSQDVSSPVSVCSKAGSHAVSACTPDYSSTVPLKLRDLPSPVPVSVQDCSSAVPPYSEDVKVAVSVYSQDTMPALPSCDSDIVHVIAPLSPCSQPHITPYSQDEDAVVPFTCKTDFQFPKIEDVYPK